MTEGDRKFYTSSKRKISYYDRVTAMDDEELRKELASIDRRISGLQVMRQEVVNVMKN